MTHGSLFSGIGGFDLAAEWMGWDNLFHCEFNPFCQKILKYYWPNSKSYGDITKSTFIEFRGRIDILTGGFPCQPFSTAGKRKGTDDSRYLWPEMLRVIREVQPRYIVGENVRGLVSWDGGLVFDTVCADLEAEGYEVLPLLLPAASVNAPHKRDRIWFIAHSINDRYSSGRGKTEEKDRIPEINRKEMDSREFDGTNIPSEFSTDSFGIGYNRYTEKIGNNSSEQFRRMVSDIGYNRNEIRSETERCSKIASDTECIRLEYTKKAGDIQESTRETFGERSQSSESVETNGINEYASNTNSKMLEYWNGEGETGKSTNQEKRIESFGSPRKWETFPTVSPICNGDDGLSDRLDSITFPKWRNESIKGGGNAIVPQVALEIFKVIQKIE
jgi:DNA (cytosine-5)-methyltransferase 1